MKPWEQYQSGPWDRYSKPDDPTEGMSRFEKLAAGTGKAVVDTGRGIKQRLDEAAAVLESMFPGGTAISMATGGKTAAQIRDQGQQEVADSKRRDAPLMNDGWGMGGNMLGGALMAAPLAPMGPVAMGATAGFMAPTTDGPEEVLKNMGTGAAFSWLGDKAVRGLSRVVQPKVRPEVKALMDEGITPTPGQILGGNAARFESKATSLPIIGDAITNAQRRAGGELNAAAFNRALSPVGESLPKGMTGREAVKYVDDTLSRAYNELLPKMTVQADAQFAQEMKSLQQMVSTGSIDPKAASAFNRILRGDVLGKFRGQNAITGQTMKQIESDLGTQVSRLANSTDADQRLVGDALKEVQSSLRQMVERSNPQYAKELKAINTGWANFKRVQRAASYTGAEDGIFSPAQLQSAVKALDRSKDKARFAKGEALMQDLSDSAKSVMGPKYPDSGTAGRLANVGAIVSGVQAPAIPLTLAAGAGAYSPPMQKALAAILTKRPDMAPMLAADIESLAPLGGLLSYTAGR